MKCKPESGHRDSSLLSAQFMTPSQILSIETLEGVFSGGFEHRNSSSELPVNESHSITLLLITLELTTSYGCVMRMSAGIPIVIWNDTTL